MSLEAEVANLTTQTSALLTAVNVSKATLDEKSGLAVTASTTAVDSKNTAVTKAAEALASATAANADAVKAKADADIATAKATVATDKATAASASATSAASSATSAATSASTATTKAAEAAASALSAVNAPGASGTSTTSLTVNVGAQTLTTQTGKAWVIGQYVTITNTAAYTNAMHGQITAYNSSTGSLTVNVLSVLGSGTAATWTIALSAPISDVVTINDSNLLSWIGV